MNFGQEIAPTDFTSYEIERAPSASELAAWNQTLKTADRVFLLLRICELEFANLAIAATFISDTGHPPLPNNPPEPVQQFLACRASARDLEVAMEKVKANELAVQFTAGDIDIVKPAENLGAVWIPIAIGVLVVGAIVARWAQLEQEAGQLADHFNGLLKRTDDHLCKDPNSQACLDWNATKVSGGYYKRETVIGNIKDAIKGAGSAAKKGLGIGALIALPMLAMYLLPKGRDKR